MDFDGLVIVMRYADRPPESHLARVDGKVMVKRDNLRPLKKDPLTLVSHEMAIPGSAVLFPKADHLSHEEHGRIFYEIARESALGYDAFAIAGAFRRALGNEIRFCRGERLIKRWTAFCVSFHNNMR